MRDHRARCETILKIVIVRTAGRDVHAQGSSSKLRDPDELQEGGPYLRVIERPHCVWLGWFRVSRCEYGLVDPEDGLLTRVTLIAAQIKLAHDTSRKDKP